MSTVGESSSAISLTPPTWCYERRDLRTGFGPPRSYEAWHGGLPAQAGVLVVDYGQVWEEERARLLPRLVSGGRVVYRLGLACSGSRGQRPDFDVMSDVAALDACVHDLRDHAGLDPARLSAVGFGLGAVVVLAWLRDFGVRVRAAVLVHQSPAGKEVGRPGGRGRGSGRVPGSAARWRSSVESLAYRWLTLRRHWALESGGAPATIARLGAGPLPPSTSWHVIGTDRFPSGSTASLAPRCRELLELERSADALCRHVARSERLAPARRRPLACPRAALGEALESMLAPSLGPPAPEADLEPAPAHCRDAEPGPADAGGRPPRPAARGGTGGAGQGSFGTRSRRVQPAAAKLPLADAAVVSVAYAYPLAPAAGAVLARSLWCRRAELSGRRLPPRVRGRQGGGEERLACPADLGEALSAAGPGSSMVWVVRVGRPEAGGVHRPGDRRPGGGSVGAGATGRGSPRAPETLRAWALRWSPDPVGSIAPATPPCFLVVHGLLELGIGCDGWPAALALLARSLPPGGRVILAHARPGAAPSTWPGAMARESARALGAHAVRSGLEAARLESVRCWVDESGWAWLWLGRRSGPGREGSRPAAPAADHA